MRLSNLIKPIILIGGTSGTGKTTLARNLCSSLEIDHRIGSGFIREIVKVQNIHPNLNSFTFRSDEPVKNLISQAVTLQRFILACIERARNEGTSLVIEGTHLIPNLYEQDAYDVFIILDNENPQKHEARMKGFSHLHRQLTQNDIEGANAIGDYFKAQITSNKIHRIIYDDNLKEIEKNICDNISKQHKNSKL